MTNHAPIRRDWHVLPRATPEERRALGQLHPLLAQLLYNRGVRTAAEARAFLSPQEPAGHDPFLLPDAEPAVQRLARAVRDGESIAIYGDFDVDGVTSTALLTEGLRGLGARVLPYIPDRVSEGHGLNLPAVQYLREAGIRLILTADCGIANAAEVAAARELGMDIIITDHHAPPERLPEAVALVDPKRRNAPLVYADLAAVGVAYKLMEGLYAHFGRPMDESLLEDVALGTVADLAPMRGENRRLVRRGLELLNKTQRPGLRALMRVAGLQPGQVDTEAIAFALGPRINAPGRIDHAEASYRLLVARTAGEAEPLAEALNAQNVEGQRLTREILASAQDRLEPLGAPILILAEPDYPPGIIGLVAGKLTEVFHRPSVVCQRGPEETRGSCRSIPEFNIIEALRQCDDLFVRYGGHAQAAGFTMATRRFPELRERLAAIASTALSASALAPRIVIDAEIALDRLTGETVKELQGLAPHGPYNAPPTFLARRVKVKDFRVIGEDGRHARLKLKALSEAGRQGGGATWSAVAFDSALGERPPASLVDVVFTLSVDRWSGKELLQMRVLDMRASA